MQPVIMFDFFRNRRFLLILVVGCFTNEFVNSKAADAGNCDLKIDAPVALIRSILI